MNSCQSKIYVIKNIYISYIYECKTDTQLKNRLFCVCCIIAELPCLACVNVRQSSTPTPLSSYDLQVKYHFICDMISPLKVGYLL